MKQISLIFSFLLCVESHAFIPPVSQTLRDIFQGRKPGAGELLLRHRIRVADEVFDIEERLGGERGRGYTSLKFSNGPTIAAMWERGRYLLAGDKQFASRSTLFTKYLLADSAEEFRDGLLAEGFLRRDQLLQYKSGYNPTGDPNTWDVKGNYLSHPDIFLSRLASGIAIAVMGTSDSSRKRTVYFDKGMNGVRKLEWVDSGEVNDWTFDHFSNLEKAPKLPRRLSFHRSGTEIIASEQLGFHPIKDKQLKENLRVTRARMQPVALSGNMEEALRVLLSHR